MAKNCCPSSSKCGTYHKSPKVRTESWKVQFCPLSSRSLLEALVFVKIHNKSSCA